LNQNFAPNFIPWDENYQCWAVLCFFKALPGLDFRRFYETCPSSFPSKKTLFSTNLRKKFQKIAKSYFA